MKLFTKTVTSLALTVTIENCQAIGTIEEWGPPFCHGQFEICQRDCLGPFCFSECTDYLNMCLKNPGFVIWEPFWWEVWPGLHWGWWKDHEWGRWHEEHRDVYKQRGWRHEGHRWVDPSGHVITHHAVSPHTHHGPGGMSHHMTPAHPKHRERSRHHHTPPAVHHHSSRDGGIHHTAPSIPHYEGKGIGHHGGEGGGSGHHGRGHHGGSGGGKVSHHK